MSITELKTERIKHFEKDEFQEAEDLSDKIFDLYDKKLSKIEEYCDAILQSAPMESFESMMAVALLNMLQED